MSVRFILGRAGSGKTGYCLDRVAEALRAAPRGLPLILLVPEQATFQMEQALVHMPGLSGACRAQVLSFRRLAWRVFLELGGPALPPLGELGKRMVLRALVERRRSDLRVFARVADRPGFIERLTHTLSELRAHGRAPADLWQHYGLLAEQGMDQSALGSKLHDLGLVLADLQAYMQDSFTDPDDYLTVLAERLPGWPGLAGAAVFIDGFSGFTPQEYAVLGAVFTTAATCAVTLCLDGAAARRATGALDPTYVFSPTLSTYDRLRRLAAEVGAPLEPVVDLDRSEPPPRFAGSPALAHIESRFFRRGRPEPLPGPAPAVALVAAATRRHEVEAAAREVLRLCREQGLRFGQIAVIVRDFAAYADRIAAVFADHEIPCFIDRRRPAPHHPLVELCRSAVEVALSDWAYEPVLRALKTDLIPVARDEVDLLENYVLEHGVRGRRWYDGIPWRYRRRYTLEEDAEPAPAEEAFLTGINATRERAAAALLAFDRRLGGRRGSRRLSAADFAAAVYRLLEDLQVADRLEEWAAAAVAAGDPDQAREHEQVWNGVLEVLDQMAAGLGELQLTVREHLQVLEAGLDGLRLGLIPPGLDQVVVGSVERSRHQGVRAALVLGATDRGFPPAPAEDVIFNDAERERLTELGLELGPTSRERLFGEQYLTYLALTRPAERLWISYPIADDEGRTVAPSPLLARLQQLLPGVERLCVGGAADPQAAVDQLTGPVQLAASLAEQLRLAAGGYPLDSVWLDLYEWVVTDPGLKAVTAPILAALGYERELAERTAPLGDALARRFYGQVLRSSVSRLESFAACPFQHFAAYGLGLQERPVHRLEAPHMGQFYHSALSLFVRRLQQRGLDWAALSPAAADALLDGIVSELAPRLHSEILLSTARHQHLLRVLGRTLRASLAALGEHARRGRFQPVGVEVAFGDTHTGDQAAALPALARPLPGGGELRLSGRIDRIDAAQAADGRQYLRVVDYKSSDRRLRLDEVYHGLSLQLLLYLHVAVANSPALTGRAAAPAGVLYFPVYDPLQTVDGPPAPEEAAALRRRRHRTRGLLLADAAVVQWMDEAAVAQASDLVPARINKDGTLARNSSVAGPEQFDRLLGHAERRVAELGQGIAAGDVRIAPYRLGDRSACGYCGLRPVCQFDPQVAGAAYRPLARLKDAEVWRALAAEGGDADA